MDNTIQTEINIERVRRLIDFNMSYEEIVEQCSDLAVEDVFLAYQAALILNQDFQI